MTPPVLLDYNLISDAPAPLYIGELPLRWQDAPTPVLVNLCDAFPTGDPYGKVSFALPFRDVLDPASLPARADLERFLDALHPYASTTPTYWHCRAGINRSAMAAAAYLHRHRGMTITAAITLIRDRRGAMCLCNAVFEAALREWYGTAAERAFDPMPIEVWATERRGS